MHLGSSLVDLVDGGGSRGLLVDIHRLAVGRGRRRLRLGRLLGLGLGRLGLGLGRRLGQDRLDGVSDLVLTPGQRQRKVDRAKDALDNVGLSDARVDVLGSLGLAGDRVVEPVLSVGDGRDDLLAILLAEVGVLVVVERRAEALQDLGVRRAAKAM